MKRFELRYPRITPIATCHWQWVANVLATQGHAEMWERLGLSWGCRWNGGSVLFGTATWPQVLEETFGARVEILTFDDAAAARDRECEISAGGLPFVAEIDSYYIPAEMRRREHTVHAVLALQRDSRHVHLVDSHIGPEVIVRDAGEFEQMRASPCEGRVEGHKLYLVSRPPTTDPAPEELLAAVRRRLAVSRADSQAALTGYIEWAQGSGQPIDVCRAAGERYQAARLFEYLKAAGLPAAERAAAKLSRLSEDWYLVHMLATHTRRDEPSFRDRIVRLLRRLQADEASAADLVLG